MSVEQALFDAARTLVERRYPTGWGGAAALRTTKGRILTSVAPDIELEALGLCMEVGAVLEAHKLNEAVTHSLCVYRDDEASPFIVQTPCGICQERLRHWGDDVQVAVSNLDNSLLFKPLKQLMPFHWSQG